jgi:hypothetical protein
MAQMFLITRKTGIGALSLVNQKDRKVEGQTFKGGYFSPSVIPTYLFFAVRVPSMKSEACEVRDVLKRPRGGNNSTVEMAWILVNLR